MKTQNQTPGKNSQEVEKGQTKVSPKRTSDERYEQDSNKLGSKKTVQSDEKMKAPKTAPKR